MDIKEYNKVQVVIFKKYKLIENKRFSMACEIIARYREINNTYYFIKCCIKDLKNNKII